MAEALYLDKPGIDSQVQVVKKLIAEIEAEVRNIDNTVLAMPENWRGNSSQKAQNAYREDYQRLITVTVPDALKALQGYIEDCVRAIDETDRQLAG